MSRAEITPAIPRPYLSPDQRPVFKAELAPIAQRARRALDVVTHYEPMGGGQPLSKKAALDSTSTQAFVDTQRHLVGKKQASSPELERAEIDSVDKSARVARLYVNEIIRRVNNIEVQAGVQKQAIPQEAAALVGRPQIKQL